MRRLINVNPVKNADRVSSHSPSPSYALSSPPPPPLTTPGNRQRVEDCRDHPYLRPNPFLGSGMNGLRLAPSGMEPVGAGAADHRMGLNTPPEMCPGCKFTWLGTDYNGLATFPGCFDGEEKQPGKSICIFKQFSESTVKNLTFFVSYSLRVCS